MIGHVQSNKCKKLATIPNLYVIETINSIKLANTLNQAAFAHATNLRVYVQVNVLPDSSKT